MKLKQFTEKEIQHQMQCNHCTREEALDILAWDYDIDHGDKEKGAPTAEQKKLIRSLTKADKAPTEKRTVKRERKVDANKAEIFEKIRAMLASEVEITAVKNEAEISFMHAGEAYTVKLTKHRAPKA
jgi:hypothetical protein